jgi:transposase, IS5 family
VLDQTKARVFGGNRHVKGKVLSLFEEHTQVISKGKAHKPNEFGRLVRIDEVENGIVSGYAVLDGNPADVNAWVPALEQHQQLFGRAPKRATADRGYFSAENEREAKARGIAQVALPARGRLSKARAEHQKQPWFRRLLRWRGGIEPRIANLKHRLGMARAFYKGDRGFKRFVGWSIISQNLVSIARTLARRKATATA